jgi:hypothetical protein
MLDPDFDESRLEPSERVLSVTQRFQAGNTRSRPLTPQHRDHMGQPVPPWLAEVLDEVAAYLVSEDADEDLVATPVLGSYWADAERKRFAKTRKALKEEVDDSDFFLEHPLQSPRLFLPPSGLVVNTARLRWKPSAKQLKAQRSSAPEGFTAGQDLAVSYWTFAADAAAIEEWEGSGTDAAPPLSQVREITGRRFGYPLEQALAGATDMATNVAALLALRSASAGFSTSSYPSTQSSLATDTLVPGIATETSDTVGRMRNRRRPLRSRPWFIRSYWLGWLTMMVTTGWFIVFMKYADSPEPWGQKDLLFKYNQGVMIGLQVFVVLSILAFSISPLGRRSTYPDPRFHGTFWFVITTFGGVALGVGAFLIMVGVVNGWNPEYGWSLLTSG